MAKNYSKFSKTKKSVLAVLAATAVLCTGLAAACSNSGSSDEEDVKYVTKQTDTQVLKNGNFEFFNYPTSEYIENGKADYLITTPDNWTEGGDSSGTMSGIINVASWDRLTDGGLKDKLDYNSDLTSTDEDYVDYNGMTSKDLLYKDTYSARLETSALAGDYSINSRGGYEAYFGIEKIGENYYIGGADGIQVYKKPVEETDGETEEETEEDLDYYLDEECTVTVREMLIDNPGTHYGDFKEEDGKYYFGETEVQLGDADSYYIEDGDEKQYVSNVLMVHAYPSTGGYNGIKKYYSSQSLTLEAGTAAEISVWVKTSDLKFDHGKNVIDDYNRGAFIEVVQTVGGTTVDSFVIKAINTEKLINNNSTLAGNNGWLNYHIYVNACDFASCTIQLNLGLGYGDDDEKCLGYAFFDDVQVTKYLTLDEEGCTYDAQNISENTTYFLTDTDKTFVADTNDREYTSADGDDYYRNSRDFHYLIDLASDTGSGYSGVSLSSGVSIGLTTETVSKNSLPVTYAASLDDVNVTNATLAPLPSGVELPTSLVQSKNVASDILGVFSASEINNLDSDYQEKLSSALTSESGKLPDYDGNILLMLSAYGAPYTATIKNDGFSLNSGESMIISFWVKTSEMNGKSAATVRLVGLTDDGERDKDKVYSVSFETTGITADFGDSKNIYNDWVQCFIFVQNEEVKGNATPTTQKFAIEFLFGNESIANSVYSSYAGGWAALTNMRTLKTTEEVFDLTASDSFSIKQVFTSDENEPARNSAFDTASGTSDIKKEIATPSNYNGYNGGSMQKNTQSLAGLINAEYAELYESWQDIANAFGYSDADAAVTWSKVFGNSYQPLIIINNLRMYGENASANENTFKNYYVEAENDYTGNAVMYEGKAYRKVAENEEYSEDIEYYSFAANYGFVGASETASANGYTPVSVKVKVSGNAIAHIYLIDGETHEVLGYTTPSVTFRYDDDGNVLSGEYKTEAEHSEAIVYTPRNDGLYDGKDGKVYANLYNLTKFYKSYIYENNEFYKDGEAVSYDKVENGEDYYRTAECNEGDFVDHYLRNSNGENIYQYVDGVYYYLVKNEDGETERSVAVENFDIAYARYTGIEQKYEFTVTAEDCAATNDGWVTVSFILKTGDFAKSYRLELWSGAREENGVDENGNFADGAIAFDYSYLNISSDDVYDAVLSTYTDKIVDAYTDLLGDYITEDGEHSITYYEDLASELVTDGTLTQEQVNQAIAGIEYTAKYYTYTLYDSEAYLPFNLETAEDGQLGYDFKISDQNETLSFLRYKDNGLFTMFADYTTVDKTIDISTDNGSDDTETDEGTPDTNVWLYVASIVLVVALLITLISLLLKDTFKKAKRRKQAKQEAKNNYRRRQRYIRKLHLVESGAEEVETPEEQPSEAPVEEETQTEADGEATPEEQPEITESETAEPENTEVETTGDTDEVNGETADTDGE